MFNTKLTPFVITCFHADHNKLVAIREPSNYRDCFYKSFSFKRSYVTPTGRYKEKRDNRGGFQMFIEVTFTTNKPIKKWEAPVVEEVTVENPDKKWWRFFEPAVVHVMKVVKEGFNKVEWVEVEVTEWLAEDRIGFYQEYESKEEIFECSKE